jgi:hypothetical protein
MKCLREMTTPCDFMLAAFCEVSVRATSSINRKSRFAVLVRTPETAEMKRSEAPTAPQAISLNESQAARLCLL